MKVWQKLCGLLFAVTLLVPLLQKLVSSYCNNEDYYWRLSYDQELAIQGFLQGKNVDLLVGSSCFHDCQLNMSCFNEDNNWYPDGKFCPQEFRTVSTAGTKFVVILVGDSRIRQLFAGVAQALLGLGGSVLRSEAGGVDGSEYPFPVQKLRLPNLRVEGGLQADFAFKTSSRMSQIWDVRFLWNPMLENSRVVQDRLETVLRKEKSKHSSAFVVFGSGLWYLAAHEGQQSYQGRYRECLGQFAAFLQEKMDEGDLQGSVFVLQTTSANYYHGLYDAEDVHGINNFAIETLESAARSITVWNSHLRLQNDYLRICHAYNIPDDFLGEWLCSNANHSGFVVVSHWARLLMHWMNAKSAK